MNADKRSSSDAEDRDASASHREGERHPSLWLEDGNIIISAKSEVTGKTLLYRIHKSLLAHQSDVFAGLFAFPDTAANYGGLKDVEGIPIVHLPDDAEGISDLLSVIYKPLELKLFTRRRNPEFPIISLRLLKLADKYNMETLKTEITSRLYADWPKDLGEWDLIDAWNQIYHTRDIFRSNWPEDLLPEPISAAILAKEAKITDIWTAVFLDMYRVSRTIDWDTADSDVSVAKVNTKGARWRLATAEQLRKLVLIQDAVERNLDTYMRDIFTVNGYCVDNSECERCLKDKRFETTSELWATRDPLAVLNRVRRWCMNSNLELPVCVGCRDGVANEASFVRESIWSLVKEVVEG